MNNPNRTWAVTHGSAVTQLQSAIEWVALEAAQIPDDPLGRDDGLHLAGGRLAKAVDVAIELPALPDPNSAQHLTQALTLLRTAAVLCRDPDAGVLPESTARFEAVFIAAVDEILLFGDALGQATGQAME